MLVPIIIYSCMGSTTKTILGFKKNDFAKFGPQGSKLVPKMVRNGKNHPIIQTN